MEQKQIRKKMESKCCKSYLKTRKNLEREVEEEQKEKDLLNFVTAAFNK